MAVSLKTINQQKNLINLTFFALIYIVFTIKFNNWNNFKLTALCFLKLKI